MNGRSTLFSLIAVPVYILGYYSNRPLFFYYPTVRSFSLTPQVGLGFVIMWYGWIAAAILIGAIAAIIVPRRWSDRIPLDLTWMMMLAAVLAVLLYERRWFF
jgi:hypothetical protein